MSIQAVPNSNCQIGFRHLKRSDSEPTAFSDLLRGRRRKQRAFVNIGAIVEASIQRVLNPVIVDPPAVWARNAKKRDKTRFGVRLGVRQVRAERSELDFGGNLDELFSRRRATARTLMRLRAEVHIS
jgi:hypothetical protein